MTVAAGFCRNDVVAERCCLFPVLISFKLHLCLLLLKIKSDRFFCCLVRGNSAAKFWGYHFCEKIWLFGKLFVCIEITEAIFALSVLSSIIWPSISSLKTREALLQRIFLMSLYDIVLKTVRILLKTSATRTWILSVNGVSAVFAWGLKLLATAENLFSYRFRGLR